MSEEIKKVDELNEENFDEEKIKQEIQEKINKIIELCKEISGNKKE